MILTRFPLNKNKTWTQVHVRDLQRNGLTQDVSFFHNPLNQNILRLLEMSGDLIHCRSCQALMELHELNETRYEDGVMHLIKEYRCKLCRSILIRDFGEVAPSSEGFPEVFEEEITIR